LFAALSVAALLPIAATRLPPILDYPNHLARMHVLASVDRSPDIARYYQVRWAPIPDLAFDLIVPFLARLVPVEAAMRLALGGMLLGLAGGCITLHRVAFGRWSFWPMTAFLLLYNRMMLWGFLNYLAGLALALWALAAWIALERRPVVVRIGIGAVTATAVYFAHLAAFGCYAVALVAYALSSASEVAGGYPARSRLIAALPALASLIPAALLFLVSPTSAAQGEISFGNPFRKLDLPISIFDNYNRALDGGTFAILLIAVILGFTRRRILLHARLRWSVLGLFAAFLLLPSRLISTAGIDHRLPVAIAFLLVAATDWNEVSSVTQRNIGGLLAVLLIVRLTVVGVSWNSADAVFDSLLPAFSAIDPGATVAVAAPAHDVQAGAAPLLHFPTLAVLYRDAFVPTLFADPTQQPIIFTPEASRLASEADPFRLWQQIAAGAPIKLPKYDYLMVIDPPRAVRHIPGLDATLLFDSPRFAILGLKRVAPEHPP
jgi:hypothetical protein